MANGVGGFLVENTHDCVSRVKYLLQNEEEAREMALHGHDRVREHFLIPRYLADTLRLLKSMLYEELNDVAA